MELKPSIISWNITRQCNLKCQHCYIDASSTEEESRDELNTEEGLKIIKEIADLSPQAMLILSGGEPLLRPDIFELAYTAKENGLIVVLGTNGTLLDDRTAYKLKRCGVSGVGISIDSIEPSLHDTFRGKKGSWNSAVIAVKSAKRHGLEVQIQTTIIKSNISEISSICDFAKSLGANAYILFFLVCTGRGKYITDLSTKEYEEVLLKVADMVSGVGKSGHPPTSGIMRHGNSNQMLIRVRCAPTYRRILYENHRDSIHLMADVAKCLAGNSYLRITPEGKVTPCPYMPLEVGDLRETSLRGIWYNSECLMTLRTHQIKGKCSRCGFRKVCGGCRARAYADCGDVMGEDPMCLYEPDGIEKEVELSSPNDKEVIWTDGAKERLMKVPPFVRKMVKNAVERYAKKEGYPEITIEIMQEVRDKMMR